MREIKFRVWNKPMRTMLPATRLTFDEAGIDGAQTDESDERGLMWIGALEVMQYTGLKDKNGKEIYEGDIVDGGKLHCTGGFEIQNERTVVNFDKGMFRAKNMSLVSFARGCEVIGNIYEHPHLLKGEVEVG